MRSDGDILVKPEEKLSFENEEYGLEWKRFRIITEGDARGKRKNTLKRQP